MANEYDPRVCDICGKRPVSRWTITNGQKVTAVVGLCQAHSEPVSEVWALGQTVPEERTRPARGGRMRFPVRARK